MDINQFLEGMQSLFTQFAAANAGPVVDATVEATPAPAPPAAPAPVAPADDTTPAAPVVGAVVSYTWSGANGEQTVYGVVVGLLAGESAGQALIAWLPPGCAQLPFGEFTVL
jgi:hypothetical protein